MFTLLGVLALISTVAGLIATVSVFRWKANRLRPRRWHPGVTILKPVRGLEPDLEINLHSFFNLKTKIPFEILFSVKDPHDPSIPVIRALMELHPDVPSKLFTGTPDLGRNPKVSNMHYAWDRASYDLLLISDSNVKVDPDYLDTLMAERQRGAGLVTQTVYGVGGRTPGSHLDVIHINTFYLKATAFLNTLGFQCVLGKCMLFSRAEFERLGGLFSVRNYLAEDLVTGEMFRDSGQAIKIAPQLLRYTSVMTNFKSYWNRHVRWARLRKCHTIPAYLMEPLFFETLWPVLLIALGPSKVWRWAGVACLVAQVTSNLALHAFKFRDREVWRSFPWFVAKDGIAPFIWAAGLISNRVVWRGQSLHLRFGGKLGTRYLKPARQRRWASLLAKSSKAS